MIEAGPVHSRAGPLYTSGHRWTAHEGAAGIGALELLFVLAIGVTLASLALPITADALDALRTASAARYLSGRIMANRIDAVKRSTAVGFRFVQSGEDYVFSLYVDGNRNGIRSGDITAGVDVPIGPVQRLGDLFPGVRFGLGESLPDADGKWGSGSDGVRIGAARILTLGPDGTASSGTLYVRGRRSQFAVRVLGATGRTRVLEYSPGGRTWISR